MRNRFHARVGIATAVLTLAACFNGNGGVCIDNVLCPRGDHFDNVLCQCVPNQDAGVVPDAGAPATDGGVCIDNVLCIRGDHFDNVLCQCVPNQDAGVALDTGAPAIDGGACIDNVLCIRGDRFDNVLCKCVPYTPTQSCNQATDCTGALPALCQKCSDGSNGCAHFTCASRQCAIAYCP